MIIRYALSGPGGSIPVGLARGKIPFKISPAENHPFLTLGDYFKAVKDFLLRGKACRLRRAMDHLRTPADGRNDLERILIYSEKHGALYHIARVEVHLHGPRKEFAVSTALSGPAKDRLRREFDILTRLRPSSGPSCLPEAYDIGEIRCVTPRGGADMVMMLGEWFDDYHEWHFVPDEKGEGRRMRLWDTKQGQRLLTREETWEIIRQSSRILTLYYDIRGFMHITPWHHAAGDFVARRREEALDVKLTTARGYEPIISFYGKEEINPLMALMTFFLGMSLKMRLDKEQGTGRILWAEKGILSAVVKGFFEGMQNREGEGGLPFGKGGGLAAFMKSFSAEELEKLLNPLLVLYEAGDPSEFPVIRGNLSPHAEELRQALQDFHG